MLLSQRIIEELYLTDTNHPRLRRHHACVNVIADYRRDVSVTKIPPSHSYSVPPPIFKKNCLHYNTEVLFLPNDLPISTVGLWRILIRSPVEPAFLSLSGTHSKNFPMTQCLPSHHAIVIRQSKTPRIRKSEIALQSTQRVTTILQTNSVPVLYYAVDLHTSPHSSASIHSIPAISFAMNRLGVVHNILSPSSAGSNGIARTRGITTMYTNSALVRSLGSSLSSIRPTIQPDGRAKNQTSIRPSIRQVPNSFHHDLAQYLISLGLGDNSSRQSGCISPGISAASSFINWGWRRIQPDTNKRTWFIDNQKMPTLNVDSFLLVPETLQNRLIMVMETATAMAQSEDSDCFPNPVRTKLFAKIMNGTMGFRSSSSLFEYVQVVISKNTILKEHIDHKNDHRKGYNFCIVYSFYHVIDNTEYRIAIIMTTRTTVGAALQSLKKS